ncbi:hypothetical protein V2J09_003304 [Rumex salicifolius]
MAEEYANSLEYAPTWIVAGVCSVILVISLSAERGLHVLGKTLKRNNQDALFQSLQKLQSELMLLGFISLLLTVFQGAISKICIPEGLTNSMLPCTKSESGHESEHSLQSTWNRRRLLSEGESHCDKGKAPLLSLEALHQLHIFIFVLAVVYVVFCATTMVLAGMKVQKWRHWEESIRREISNERKEPSRVTRIHARHQLIFNKRAFGNCTWMLSFFKQFYGSVSKSDYIALRNGFIMAHCPTNPSFDFHKYMMKTLECDFKKVVGISSYLWAFVVVFLLVNLKATTNGGLTSILMYRLLCRMAFILLAVLFTFNSKSVLLLLVGAKLEHIITCLAEEIAESSKNNASQTRPDHGAVKPSDKHFWFGRPSIILYMIHFILFQNSFEIAFLFWVLCTYGIHSCILDRIAFIVPRLILGVIVQVLCSYSTLPLYTIVTQMGSRFKQSIFNEHINVLLHNWADEHSRGHSTRSLLARTISAEMIELDLQHETGVVIETPPLPPSAYPSSNF